MKTTKEMLQDSIKRYIDKVEVLKQELKEIESSRKDFDNKYRTLKLSDFEIKMLKKGLDNRKTEVDNEIRNIHIKMGRITVKEANL